MNASPKKAAVRANSLETFLHSSVEKGLPGGVFEKEGERILRIDVNGGVWIKPGIAIAYRGDLHFERLPTLEAHGVREMVQREVVPIARAEGQGRLYCAWRGWHVRVLKLDGEVIHIVSDQLLAFEESIEYEIKLVGENIGVAAGGLLAVRLSGRGSVAIAMHGDPLTLQVTPDKPVSTDPHATVGWLGNMTPELKTDLSWRSLFEHGGGEPVQMFFEGNGYVVVKPS